MKNLKINHVFFALMILFPIQSNAFFVSISNDYVAPYYCSAHYHLQIYKKDIATQKQYRQMSLQATSQILSILAQNNDFDMSDNYQHKDIDFDDFHVLDNACHNKNYGLLFSQVVELIQKKSNENLNQQIKWHTAKFAIYLIKNWTLNKEYHTIVKMIDDKIKNQPKLKAYLLERLFE